MSIYAIEDIFTYTRKRIKLKNTLWHNWLRRRLGREIVEGSVERVFATVEERAQ